MGSYAPICRIRSVTGDPLTATSILVDTGLGDIFQATPPFTILVWPTQQYPIIGTNPYQDTNAEECTVTARQDDHLTLVRSAVPIALQAGLMIGQVDAQPVVAYGEVLALVETISGGTIPYALHLAAPDGSLAEVDGLSTAEWAGTVGRAPITQSGQWHYQFVDAHGKRSPYQDLFVKFATV